MNDCKGYTLIEVLVALVCLSIMTAALFPAFVWFMNESADVKRVRLLNFCWRMPTMNIYLSMNCVQKRSLEKQCTSLISRKVSLGLFNYASIG